MHKNTKHGHSKKPEYKIWASLLQRCNNPNCKDYPNYGGRGITCPEEWKDFERFIEDVGWRPSKEYSLDRTNNKEGYSKENCEWVLKTQQGRNQRTSSLNKSGQRGVRWIEQNKKWMVRITVNKERKYLGLYEDLEDAVKARKEAELKYW